MSEPFDFSRPIEVEAGMPQWLSRKMITDLDSLLEVVVDPSTPAAAEYEVNALLDLRLDMMGERDCSS